LTGIRIEKTGEKEELKGRSCGEGQRNWWKQRVHDTVTAVSSAAKICTWVKDLNICAGSKVQGGALPPPWDFHIVYFDKFNNSLN
jgi:hypothetical protein